MNKPIYLYITPFFPSPESWRGGFCLDAAKAIARDGRYDVRVIVSGDGPDYNWDGVRVYRMRRVIAPCGLIPFFFAKCNNRHFSQKLKSIGIAVKNVSVCHVNTLNFGHYAAYFKALNPEAKTVVQLHSSFSLDLRSGRAGIVPIHATLLYLYYRSVLKCVDMLAFVSKMSMETFGKRYVGVPEGERKDVRSQLLLGRLLPTLVLPRQIVVYNGIDSDLFKFEEKVPHDGFVIGCVANFQPLKDHMTLLRAVKILKKKICGLKVRLIGSGETFSACKKYVVENLLQDIVSFETEVDHLRLPAFYRSLDLFVLPSRLEGFLCVCVESWACGTPSIFCQNIALSELVPQEDVKKWLFEPQNAEDLADKICSWYANRWSQHFSKNLEINGIWKDFLDGLEER